MTRYRLVDGRIESRVAGGAWSTVEIPAAARSLGKARNILAIAADRLGLSFVTIDPSSTTLTVWENWTGAWHSEAIFNLRRFCDEQHLESGVCGDEELLHWGAQMIADERGVTHVALDVLAGASLTQIESGELFYLGNANGAWTQEHLSVVPHNHDNVALCPVSPLEPAVVVGSLSYSYGNPSINTVSVSQRSGSSWTTETIAKTAPSGYAGPNLDVACASIGGAVHGFYSRENVLREFVFRPGQPITESHVRGSTRFPSVVVDREHDRVHLAAHAWNFESRAWTTYQLVRELASTDWMEWALRAAPAQPTQPYDIGVDAAGGVTIIADGATMLEDGCQ